MSASSLIFLVIGWGVIIGMVSWSMPRLLKHGNKL